MDEGRTGDLVFYAFDLLFLDGTSTMELPLIERKARLEPLFATAMPGLRFSDHIIGDGPKFREHACRLSLEGAVSKRLDRPYAPGDRGLWVKSKCLNREEFVVVVDRSNRQPPAHRRAAIRRPGRHRHHGRRAQASGRPSCSSESRPHGARHTATAR